jgi:drug/metabolite transporter (DMT)-like permease
LGICGLYFGQYFVVIGLQHSSAVVAATWSNSIPVFTYLLGLILKTERCSFDAATGLKLAGLMLAVGGSVDASVGSNGGSHKASSLIATVCFLLQVCFGGAIFWHLQKKMLSSYPAMQVASWYYSYGTVILVLVVLPSATTADKWALGSQDLIALLYAILLWPSAAFALTYANENASPVTVMIFAPVQIVAATILEYALHGIVPTISRVVGSVFVIAGLISFVAGRAVEIPAELPTESEASAARRVPPLAEAKSVLEEGSMSHTDPLLENSHAGKQAI